MAIRADRVGVREDQVDIHGRVTSPSFLNELLEDLPEWTDMPVWVNGTEELLPSNNSAPVTSPILTDIAYPDIRRDNQYFTYRESPTLVDGLAKIKSIKGNTLIWNQLIQNGNFETAIGWAISGRGTMTVSNNVATITPNRSGLIVTGPVISITQGHKYLLSVEVKADSTSVWLGMQYNDIHVRLYSNGTNQWQRITSIISNFVNDSMSAPVFGDGRPSGWTASQIRNFMFIDLTDIFGAGNEPTTVEEFTSLFPLPYYEFNQGTLIPFNGTGIKTTGKNLLNARATQTTNGITFTNDNGVITINGTATANAYFVTNIGLPNGSYFIGAFNDEINNYVHVAVQNKSGAYPLDATLSSKNRTLSLNNDIDNFIIWVNSGTTLNNFVLKPMISFDSPEYFEPYTETTTDLPISTYFPTGMKSAGSVYDELTPMKAITRIGAVDLGTLDWYVSNGTMYANLPDAYLPSTGATVANAICPKYTTAPLNYVIAKSQDKILALNNGQPRVNVYDSAYTDATAFKTAMSGVYLFYELATPVELPTMSFE